MVIYHNPRCSKSRETLAILEEKKLDFQVIHYLDNPLDMNTIKQLLQALNISPRALMRTHEAVYKAKRLAEENDETVLIQAMVENPILIERPIVKTKQGVIIGRPPKNVLTII
jgi:arsenate reductase